MAPGRLTPRELAARLALGEPLLVLDVRERVEIEVAPFPGARWIPLGELARRLAELDPGQPVVCLCHHGVRSAQAAARLDSAGFAQVWNLSGGIDRWSVDVDPQVARY